ncbi:MAG: DUF2157 domain-containing protein [Megasphaera sp.]|jgi:hypothetical protein|nr:DUF2157 domain-containing protein [Megasphaera sp.]
MIKNKNKWLEKSGKNGMVLPVYCLIAIIGISIVCTGVVWFMAHTWYHFTVAGRMAVAVVLLLVSQIGVAAAMFQEKQGSLIGEGLGAAHCLIVFVVMAMAEQTFYIGWDIPSYLAVSAILCLPAVYLLRSAASAVIYSTAVLLWAALGGPVNAVGGSGFMWLLLLLIVPFYNVLVQHGDEVRLSIFSWVVTITVFAAFGLAARTEEYIPFLMLSALSVTIMLAGYSIDVHKAWGVPFRWFGRFATAGALLISCIPSSWDGIARIQGFHWGAAIVTVILFIAMAALLVKGVKKRLWGPVIYAFVPVLLAFETILVRSALYSSVPLVVSSMYLLGLGFYETAQGFRPGHSMHMKLGILILAGLVIAFVIGASASVLVPLVAIIILALVFVQFRRSRITRQAASRRSVRRTKIKHHGTTIHGGHKRKVSAKKRTAHVPKQQEPLEAKDVQQDAETLDDWMKSVHIPDSFKKPAVEETETEDSVVAEMMETAEPHLQQGAAQTVIPKQEPDSLFVAPVFHNPDAIPVTPEEDVLSPKNEAPQPERQGSSPWQEVKPPQRKKHFTRSPWAQEGENKND